MAAVVKCQAVKKDGQSCRNTGKVTRDQVTYCGVHDPYKSRNGIQVVTIDQPNWVKVIDDPDSWVAVYQGWVEDADSLFKDLKENVPWHFRKVKMRGRDVAIPRGSFFLCEDRANYPGATNKDKLNHAIWEDSTSESDYINLVRSLLDKINHDRTIKKLTK